MSTNKRVAMRGMHLSFFAALLALALTNYTTSACAEPIKIVAIGASNTAGSAVGAGSAYPAVLQRMLRAKGYDVTIENKGVYGDTSAGILSRVDSAITPGTKIVIFDAGGGNDKDTGAAAQTAGNKARIEQASAFMAPRRSSPASQAFLARNKPIHRRTFRAISITM